MKQQKQIVALVVLLVAAAAIWFYNSRQSPVAAGASTIASNYSPMNVDNLKLRTAERAASRGRGGSAWRAWSGTRSGSL